MLAAALLAFGGKPAVHDYLNGAAVPLLALISPAMGRNFFCRMWTNKYFVVQRRIPWPDGPHTPRYSVQACASSLPSKPGRCFRRFARLFSHGFRNFCLQGLLGSAAIGRLFNLDPAVTMSMLPGLGLASFSILIEFFIKGTTTMGLALTMVPFLPGVIQLKIYSARSLLSFSFTHFALLPFLVIHSHLLFSRVSSVFCRRLCQRFPHCLQSYLVLGEC